MEYGVRQGSSQMLASIFTLFLLVAVASVLRYDDCSPGSLREPQPRHFTGIIDVLKQRTAAWTLGRGKCADVVCGGSYGTASAWPMRMLMGLMCNAQPCQRGCRW